jgi:hypothetical protein
MIIWTLLLRARVFFVFVCRSLLLHWLAVGDWSYTQLIEQLPADLQVWKLQLLGCIFIVEEQHTEQVDVVTRSDCGMHATSSATQKTNTVLPQPTPLLPNVVLCPCILPSNLLLLLLLLLLQDQPSLVEEVLTQLAVFRQPRLGAAGCYCLK